MGYYMNGSDRCPFRGIIRPYSWIKRGKEKNLLGLPVSELRFKPMTLQIRQPINHEVGSKPRGSQFQPVASHITVFR